MSLPKQTRQLDWSRCVGVGMLILMFTGTTALPVESLSRYEFLQIRMGIPVKITLYASSRATANRAADAAFARFRDLDRVMSDYDPDSELMRICNSYRVNEPIRVSRDLFAVLSEAQSFFKRTGGAFDVTVGEVVKLWRIARRRKRLPDHERLNSALQRVGFQFVRLDSEKRTITFLKSGMQLDLGGIAKGYAADEALAVMKEQGVARVLIDAGGDFVAGDSPPDRDFWRIAVEKLRRKDEEGESLKSLKIRNCGVATSGDAYQFLEIDGTRYSHLIDPQTGVGLTTPSSVTVIAPTGMEADSLASAFSVMDDSTAIEKLCDESNAEYLKVELTMQQLVEESSPGFATYWHKTSSTTPLPQKQR